MEATQEYLDSRHTSTLVDIEQCYHDRKQLIDLLEVRKTLARIYAEDGAIKTARAIETIDIALIEDALRA
jgi:hypothetical protein